MFNLFKRKKAEAEDDMGTYMLAMDIVRMARPLPARVLIYIIAKMVENSDMDEDEVTILCTRVGFIAARKSNKSVHD